MSEKVQTSLNSRVRYQFYVGHQPGSISFSLEIVTNSRHTTRYLTRFIVYVIWEMGVGSSRQGEIVPFHLISYLVNSEIVSL